MMKLELPDLPYNADDLEPHISVETIKFHYLKHHKGYVDKAITLVKGTELEAYDVEDIIAKTRDSATYNAAAQIWNHDLYWKSMKKDGGGKPSGLLEKQIINDFGTFEKFRDEFKRCGLSEFGSGYVWLTFDNNKLQIVSSTDAQIPVKNLDHALLNMDVWEHSYYIDYRNERGKYIDAFLDHLANWDSATKRLEKIK